MKEQVSQIRELMPDLATGAPPGGWEPYALAPQSEQRLKLLDQLGIVEFARAVSEQRAGRKEQADRHFQQARDRYQQVLVADGGDGDRARELKIGEKIDRVSARLSLAQVEYVQGEHSPAALQKAIDHCLGARSRSRRDRSCGTPRDSRRRLPDAAGGGRTAVADTGNRCSA
jgi:hypothetical protein